VYYFASGLYDAFPVRVGAQRPRGNADIEETFGARAALLESIGKTQEELILRGL